MDPNSRLRNPREQHAAACRLAPFSQSPGELSPAEFEAAFPAPVRRGLPECKNAPPGPHSLQLTAAARRSAVDGLSARTNRQCLHERIGATLNPTASGGCAPASRSCMPHCKAPVAGSIVARSSSSPLNEFSFGLLGALDSPTRRPVAVPLPWGSQRCQKFPPAHHQTREVPESPCASLLSERDAATERGAA